LDDEAITKGRSVMVTVLANDVSGEPGGGLTVVSVTDGVLGTVVINPDGTVTYTPRPGASGTDTFTYTVCQTPEPLTCTTATVTVEVSERPTVVPTATTFPVESAGRKNAQRADAILHRDPLPEPSGASLPFTGAAIMSLLTAGLLLVAVGLGLTSRKKASAAKN
jgi:hypothetical protein